MKTKPFIVACIPAYNEEKTIAKVILQTKKYVDKIIVCNDGSMDMTTEIARELGAIVINHKTNKGYGAALASLFQKAREINADIMITIDADGQHDPSYIPQLIQPILEEKADIVIGSRFLQKTQTEIPKYREIGIKVITQLAKKASYNNITDAQSGLRAYSKKAIQNIKPKETGMGASTEILIQAKQHNLKITEIPVTINYNVEKPSTHNPIIHALAVLLSIVKYISIRHPVLYYGVPGFIAIIISLALWIQALTTYTVTGTLPLTTTLLAVTTTLIGLILTITAIILYILANLLSNKRRL